MKEIAEFKWPSFGDSKGDLFELETQYMFVCLRIVWNNTVSPALRLYPTNSLGQKFRDLKESDHKIAIIAFIVEIKKRQDLPDENRKEFEAMAFAARNLFPAYSRLIK